MKSNNPTCLNEIERLKKEFNEKVQKERKFWKDLDEALKKVRKSYTDKNLEWGIRL